MSTPNRLLLLPLLQGLSKEELLQIAGRVRFNFHNRSRSEVIVSQDCQCRSLFIATAGELCVQRTSNVGDFVLSEWFPTPFVIQPEALFGWRTHYTHTIVCATDVSLLEIDKDAVRDVLFHYPAFRISFLNQISYTVQRQEQSLWREPEGSLYGRFCHFLLQRCLRPAGRKELKIRKKDLARHLNASIRYVAPFLHNLQAQGKIELTRGYLRIPSMERLLNAQT